MEKEILFGAAYYPEYMPYERVKEGYPDDERSGNECGENCGIYMEHVGTGRWCI